MARGVRAVLTARKGGELISLHPKLVDKWARRYIRIYKEKGSVLAKRWAKEFLPTEAEQTAMSSRVKEILKQK